jgi:hypothetical protein
MNVVQSLEAQEANDISEVLHRRQFTDGTNMLSALHYSKKLQKVPVGHVSLTPTPSQKISLAEVNVEINKIKGGYTPPKTDPASQMRITTENVEKNMQAVQPIETESTLVAAAGSTSQTEDVLETAKALLIQAELMEGDADDLAKQAKAKRTQAYRLNPSLKPKSTKKSQ